MATCELIPLFRQLYTKCHRSGYTIMLCCHDGQASQVKEKLLGIQSKTGEDAQENNHEEIGCDLRSYASFKPIQDGTTNPRMELAFREPSKRITKNNKTSCGVTLNTVINWKNTTGNAYDGEKLHMLYLDEAGKWEKPTDIRGRSYRADMFDRSRKVVGKLSWAAP